MAQTSKRVARLASKELRRKKLSVATRMSVAASDLRQARRKSRI